MSDSVAVAKPVVSEPLVSRLPVFRHGLGSFAKPRGIARHLLNITGGEIFYGIWRWLPEWPYQFFADQHGNIARLETEDYSDLWDRQPSRQAAGL
jgi:hypothetical protein